jgi:hypothetical protein
MPAIFENMPWHATMLLLSNRWPCQGSSTVASQGDSVIRLFHQRSLAEIPCLILFSVGAKTLKNKGRMTIVNLGI